MGDNFIPNGTRVSFLDRTGTVVGHDDEGNYYVEWDHKDFTSSVPGCELTTFG